MIIEQPLNLKCFRGVCLPLILTIALVLVPSLNADDTKTSQIQSEVKREVRVIYLVSTDRDEVKEYKAAVEHAIRDLQGWYAKQLKGTTFKLHEPVVEVVKSRRPAAWFNSNPNGPNKADWGHNNTLQEAAELVSARNNDPSYVWVLYSDGPGNTGRGGSGVCYLPEDDLLGLVGRHPTQPDRLRWIAGLGHELGHAFGLPHPEDTKKDADAIMWTGIYGKYPDRTYLTESDKKLLMRSDFFYYPNGKAVNELGKVVLKYKYNGGEFIQHQSEPPLRWSETTADGKAVFHFEEHRRDRQYITLFDESRKIYIRIPVDGGLSTLSTDSERTWKPLYEVSMSDGKR